MGDIPRYPPFTEGLPAASPKALLDTQESLIRQLKHELALTPEQEKSLIDPLLISYASFVHLLPASKAHHHRGAGGMLRHGLEVALWASRGFHGKIIDGHETGERRKILEPRWRLAVAVAGLCHDIGKTAYDVVVTDPTGKKVWDVYGGLLSEWIENENLDRYFISWRSGREHKVHERFGHLLTMRVIPREVLSYLNEADPRIIAVMHETIAGQIPKGAARVVHELVMAADQRSVQRDIKGQRVADSDAALGVPVAKYLVDAMKRLIEQGKWKANTEGQPLWVTGKGVFLDWEKAVPGMVDLLLADGISGIPRSQNSIAESLSDFDIIQKQMDADGTESFYVAIAPEKLCSKKKVHRFKAVELTGLDILFDGPHPAPVDVHVGNGAIDAREQLNEKRDKKLAEERNDRALKRHEDKVQNQADGQSRPYMPDSAPESEADDTDKAAQAEVAPSMPEVEVADLDALNRAKGEPEPAPTKQEPAWIATLSEEQREVVERCFIPEQSDHAHDLNGEIVVQYPAGLDGFGDQRNAKLELIKPLLAPNPTFPERPTQKRKIGGKEVNALVLSSEASEGVRALASTQNEKPAKKKVAEVAKKAPKKPKAQTPKKPKAQTPPKAQVPPKAKASPEPEVPITPSPEDPKPETQNPKKPKAKAEPQSPKKKPAGKPKPPAQKPPKPDGVKSESSMVIELKEKVLESYPNEKIEDRNTGGYWVSVPDSAQWYIQNVRPDLRLGPVMAALYRLKDSTDQAPPNNDQDYVLVKRSN